MRKLSQLYIYKSIIVTVYIYIYNMYSLHQCTGRVYIPQHSIAKFFVCTDVKYPPVTISKQLFPKIAKVRSVIDCCYKQTIFVVQVYRMASYCTGISFGQKDFKQKIRGFIWIYKECNKNHNSNNRNYFLILILYKMFITILFIQELITIIQNTIPKHVKHDLTVSEVATGKEHTLPKNVNFPLLKRHSQLRIQDMSMSFQLENIHKMIQF
eukprot:TRINITY_DN9389_c1_g1_i3.p1 TRINITY_DN9389_c1_g1~~TRINITY_DN9389_c1_g1_i3.p1  ORF type:complete len:211 (+),score=-15.42 TRINITY_DN9389_c1_g1_i3:656-1288(+)